MKTIKFPLIIFALVLLAGCIPDVGNPDLAGSWSCTETSQIFMKSTKGTSTYQVTLVQDAVNTDLYRIDNFYGLGSGIQVSVVKSGYSLSLLKQRVDGFDFEGVGTINDMYDLINLTYTADDGGGQVDHVTAEYSR